MRRPSFIAAVAVGLSSLLACDSEDEVDCNPPIEEYCADDAGSGQASRTFDDLQEAVLQGDLLVTIAACGDRVTALTGGGYQGNRI